MSDPLFHITPGQVAAFVPMAFVLAWLMGDDDEDEALSLEKLPHGELFDERDDEPCKERVTAHLPSVLEDLGLL